MKREKEEEAEIRKKIETYFEKNIPVHAVTNNGAWINGEITEINTDSFIVEEDKLGPIPIFYKEVGRLEAYHQKSFTFQ